MLGELFARAARLFLCPRATRGAVSRHASPPSRHGTPDARHGGRAGGTRVSSPRKRESLIPLSRLCIKWIHGSGPGSRNHSFHLSKMVPGTRNRYPELIHPSKWSLPPPSSLLYGGIASVAKVRQGRPFRGSRGSSCSFRVGLGSARRLPGCKLVLRGAGRVVTVSHMQTKKSEPERGERKRAAQRWRTQKCRRSAKDDPRSSSRTSLEPEGSARARARRAPPKGGEPNGAVGALRMILGAHLVRPWKSFISNAWRAVRQGGEAVPVPSRDAWSSL